MIRVALALVLVAASPWMAPGPSRAAGDGAGVPAQRGSASGLPLPRFVSLKADRVNLRNGPGTEYPTSWVFRRAGMPVEVLEEFDAWRQVRDAEGVTGWVLQSLLSGRRTGLVLPWELKKPAPDRAALRAEAGSSAPLVAIIEAGVIADVHGCDGSWCRVVIGSFRGYIEQNKLWGVYAGEIVR